VASGAGRRRICGELPTASSGQGRSDLATGAQRRCGTPSNPFKCLAASLQHSAAAPDRRPYGPACRHVRVAARIRSAESGCYVLASGGHCPRAATCKASCSPASHSIACETTGVPFDAKLRKKRRQRQNTPAPRPLPQADARTRNPVHPRRRSHGRAARSAQARCKRAGRRSGWAIGQASSSHAP
jgi:hypothetical protein